MKELTMHIKRATIIWAFVLSLGCILPQNTYAQPTQPSEPPSIVTLPASSPIIEGGPTSVNDWYTKIFQNIVGWAFTIAIVLGVLMLIIAGIMYMTAGGNQDKVGTAVKMVMYALIGVAIAGLAWALVNTIGNFFLGRQLLNP